MKANKSPLHEGVMKSAELAEWFDCKPHYFQSHKSKFLEKLKDYCSFDNIHGGVNIKEIYIPIYDKSLPSKAIERMYLEEVLSHENHLCSLAGMSRKFIDQGKFDCAMKTGARRLKPARTTLFGTFDMETGDSISGSAGNYYFVWGVKLDDYDNYRELTPEELQIFRDTVKEYKTEEELLDERIDMYLKISAYEEEEMSKEEFIASYKKYMLGFDECIMNFNVKTGLKLVRCTKHRVRGDLTSIEEEGLFD